jgi:hypothetical protein
MNTEPMILFYRFTSWLLFATKRLPNVSWTITRMWYIIVKKVTFLDLILNAEMKLLGMTIVSGLQSEQSGWIPSPWYYSIDSHRDFFLRPKGFQMFPGQ